MVSIMLIATLILWGIYLTMEGTGKARFLYVLNAPELEICKNGIQWMRTHNLSLLRYIRSGIVYLIVVTVKILYLHEFIPEVELWKQIILITGTICIPVSMFFFFHDRAYYREYNRLLNVPHEECWYTEKKIPALIIVVGKKQRNSILIAGIGLLILQYVALFIL